MCTSVCVYAVVDCGSLPNPPNGTVSLSSTLFGSMAEYQCNRDSILVGSRVRECTATGEWSPTEPACEGTLTSLPAHKTVKLFMITCHIYHHTLDISVVCSLCHENANCINFGEQTYRCVCVGGFQGDGINCRGEKN